MELTDQPQLLDTLRKKIPVPIGGEAGQTSEPVWIQWLREKILSLPLLGTEPWSSSPYPGPYIE